MIKIKRRKDPLFKDVQGRYVVCVSQDGRTKFIGSFKVEESARRALQRISKEKTPKQWVHYY